MPDSDDKSEKTRRYAPGEVLRKVPWSEIRRQLVTSLGTAFGVLIGFVWTQVVIGAFQVAQVITPLGITSWGSWVLFVVGAFAVTFISVIMIIIMTRIKQRIEKT